jgi:predicted transcriptional regulator
MPAMRRPYIGNVSHMPQCTPPMKGKTALALRTSEKIREWCAKSGFASATAAAKYLGIAQATFDNYYSGKRVPRLDHWETICRKLGGNLNEIFCYAVSSAEKSRKWMTVLKAKYETDPKEKNNIELFVRGLWKGEDIQNEIIEWLKH